MKKVYHIPIFPKNVTPDQRIPHPLTKSISYFNSFQIPRELKVKIKTVMVIINGVDEEKGICFPGKEEKTLRCRKRKIIKNPGEEQTEKEIWKKISRSGDS